MKGREVSRIDRLSRWAIAFWSHSGILAQPPRRQEYLFLLTALAALTKSAARPASLSQNPILPRALSLPRASFPLERTLLMRFPRIKFMQIKVTGHKLEVAVPKPVQIWAGRAAAGAAIGLVHASLQGQMPRTLGEVLSVVGVAAAAVSPAGERSNLVRPSMPGQLSVLQTLFASIRAFLAAPKAERVHEVEVLAEQAAAKKFAELLKTGQFVQTQGGLAPVPEDGAAVLKAEDAAATAAAGIPDVASTGLEVVAPDTTADAEAANHA